MKKFLIRLFLVDSVVHILDLETDVWTNFPTQNKFEDKPYLALSGHTAVAKDSHIVVFGGESEEDPCTNDLYYYDLFNNEWVYQQTVDTIPPPRTRHASCLSKDGKRMYISGGLLNGKDVAKDLYWFDFDTRKWNGPIEFVPRYGHTIAMYNNKIWAFGGLTAEMDRISELSWYDLETDAIGNVSIIPMEDPIKSSLPAQGIHMYGDGVTGTMLDVVTAGSAIRNVETSISALDLDTLKIRSIISDCSKYFDGYTWHHMLNLKSKLILLGQPGTALDDGRMSDIFTLDLTEFGYMESEKSRKGVLSAAGTIASDMFEFFKRSELCDFEITAVEGDVRPPLFHTVSNSFIEEAGNIQLERYDVAGRSESIGLDSPSQQLTRKPSSLSLDRSRTDDLMVAARQNSTDIPSPEGDSPIAPASSNLPTFKISEPIKVHMMVLFARWPHFKRIMSSQMNEYHCRKLHIPEPVAWVRKLIEFMYCDSIDTCTVEETSGLLVLANLYELPRLRSLCIESISKEGISDNNAVVVWQRAFEAEEEVIRRNAALHCFRHWGQIVRSQAFRELDKESLIALCEEADTNAFVSSYTPPPPINVAEDEEEEYRDENMQGSSVTGIESDAYEDDMDLWN